MPPLVWSKSSSTVLQEYENRHGPTPPQVIPLVTWAVFAVENLYYLDDLDQVQATYPSPVQGHHADIVDIAHVRWATVTAITSLDLCAAALGRHYCGWTERRELDLRSFEPRSFKLGRLRKAIRSILPARVRRLCRSFLTDRRSKLITKRRLELPAPALAWVDSVLNDNEYIQIRDVRDYFTHSRLPRHLARHQIEFVGGATIGGASSHVERSRFRFPKTGKTLGARELVTLSKDLATRQISAFLDVIDRL